MSLNRNSNQKVQLNNEELQKLLNKMSSDERKQLTDTLKQCTTEVTLTRGIPITAAILGSLYYARTRLPAQYHFGPKGWPFYAIVGIGTLTTTNILSMGTCRDRIQPLIAELWQKYNMSQSTTSYDEIRRRHREEYGFQTPDTTTSTKQPRKFEDMRAHTDRPYTDPYSLGTETTFLTNTEGASDKYDKIFDFTNEETSGSQKKNIPPQSYMYGMEEPTYMSGTPTTPRSPHLTSEFSR